MLRMRRWLKSDASELSSALYPKMLNSIEDAHLKNMGTFETDEHLQARCLLPRLPRLGRNGDRQGSSPEMIWLPCH
jgi:hypothetical protein